MSGGVVLFNPIWATSLELYLMLGCHHNHNIDIVSVSTEFIISKNDVYVMRTYYVPGVLFTHSLNLLTSMQSSYDYLHCAGGKV